jgi:hypothetical protein
MFVWIVGTPLLISEILVLISAQRGDFSIDISSEHIDQPSSTIKFWEFYDQLGNY